MDADRCKALLGVCGTLLLLLFAAAGARAQSVPAKSQAEAGATPKLAEEEYKNIQVLKGIPAE